MRPARILIVDDSAVIRRVLSDLLASDPEIVVAGTAGNGSQALARIPEISPDLVTLDIEMPGMNGLETLAEIRRLHPKLPVISSVLIPSMVRLQPWMRWRGAPATMSPNPPTANLRRARTSPCG